MNCLTFIAQLWLGLYERFCRLREDIQFLDKQIACLVKQNESCCRLADLEGVGPISSILLFAH